VNGRVHLSEFRPSDKAALVQSLNDREIYDRTLRIPCPYTRKDAANTPRTRDSAEETSSSENGCTWLTNGAFVRISTGEAVAH
jgi:hypothetical protein